jgi:succinate dehydrogenase / fumarate reductase cytochrome b subunit
LVILRSKKRLFSIKEYKLRLDFQFSEAYARRVISTIYGLITPFYTYITHSKGRSSMQVNRPLSPHITIYKPQISSMLSITHRLTGVALVLGSWLLAAWVIFSAYGCGKCITPLIHSPLGTVLLVAWSAALFYHMLNGIRHLFWDIGYGYSIPAMTRSGFAVVIGTVVLTAVVWSFGLGIISVDMLTSIGVK